MTRTAAGEKVQDVADWLLVYEATDSASSETDVSAAARVSEKLRGPVSTLAGASGFHALLTRSLILAKSECNSLSGVRIELDGSVQGLNELPEDQAREAGRLLICQLLGLLAKFIGESLLLQLVQDVWPDLPLDGADSGGQNRHDAAR